MNNKTLIFLSVVKEYLLYFTLPFFSMVIEINGIREIELDLKFSGT